MSSETASTPTTVLALIPLPEFDALSERQVRGSACVWCEVTLSADVAVDLGERSSESDGVAWFPRGCQWCAVARSMAALRDHSGSCEQCVDDYTECSTGVGLVRAVREARR